MHFAGGSHGGPARRCTTTFFISPPASAPPSACRSPRTVRFAPVDSAVSRAQHFCGSDDVRLAVAALLSSAVSHFFEVDPNARTTAVAMLDDLSVEPAFGPRDEGGAQPKLSIAWPDSLHRTVQNLGSRARSPCRAFSKRWPKGLLTTPSGRIVQANSSLDRWWAPAAAHRQKSHRGHPQRRSAEIIGAVAKQQSVPAKWTSSGSCRVGFWYARLPLKCARKPRRGGGALRRRIYVGSNRAVTSSPTFRTSAETADRRDPRRPRR